MKGDSSMQPHDTRKRQKNRIDMTGQRVGRVTVLREAGYTNNGAIRWLCLCDCGREFITTGKHLRKGETRSCGCVRYEKLTARNTTHNLSDHRLYVRWAGIIARCTNRNNISFKNYGGRGISVCLEWRDSFPAFLAHVSALPHFGEPGRSIDRIDNDGNYEPGNVRWATRKEQQANKRRK